MQVFDAPIPGQSLTKTPGSYKYERPPQFTEEEPALEWLWERLLQKDSIARIRVLLQNDISVVEMAQTILFAAVADGRVSLDLAFLMAQETTWMIEAIAKKSGVKKYTYKKEKPEYEDFINEYAEFLAEPDKEEQQAAAVATNVIFPGLV